MKKHKKIIINIITVLVFLLIAIYLYKNKSVFQYLKNLNFSFVFLVIFTQIVTVLCTALLNKQIINISQKKVSYKECVLLQYTNNFLNKIITKGGTIFRGYYLKEMYGFAYSRYVSTLAGLYIISFLSYSFFGIVSLVIIYLKLHVYNISILLFFTVLFVVTLFLISTKAKVKLNRKKRILNLIGNLLDGWEEIKKNPKELLILLGITLILLLISILQTIVIYKGLGSDLGFIESMYMSTISIITIFINITPGGIGVKEGIYMFSSRLIGMNPDIIVLGSLIGRVIALIPSVLFGGISYLILTRKVKSKNLDEINIRNILNK